MTNQKDHAMNTDRTINNILKVARKRGGGLRVNQDEHGVWQIRDRKTQGGTLWVTIEAKPDGAVAYTMAMGGPSCINYNATERQVHGEISDWVGA